MMTLREKGLLSGREAGASAKKLPQAMKEAFAQWRLLYATAADMDFAEAVRALDRERLADVPSYTTFPELRGHIDLLRAEREGFRETSGLDETAVAFQFSGDFLMRRRLETRHLARWDHYLAATPGCTNVFIPGGAEGVTLSDNRDIGLLDDMSELAAWRPEFLFKANKDGVHWHQGGVSAAVLLDDEPRCSFPADPIQYQHLIPEEAFEDIDVMMEFLTRYNEFWGPGNKILVDRKLNAVAAEKTNCQVAFRKPTVNGAIAITACAYLDDKLSAHQLARAAKAAAIKKETVEDNLACNYHLGSRQRYRRLVALTDAAAKGKPTIWDALNVVADHAVPYPDRVCLAGESLNSTERNPKQNWSVTQHAAVITGPNRRALYHSVQSRANPKPVYEYPPKLMLGPGVKMQPEWQKDINAGRCLPSM